MRTGRRDAIMHREIDIALGAEHHAKAGVHLRGNGDFFERSVGRAEVDKAAAFQGFGRDLALTRFERVIETRADCLHFFGWIEFSVRLIEVNLCLRFRSDFQTGEICLGAGPLQRAMAPSCGSSFRSFTMRQGCSAS